MLLPNDSAPPGHLRIATSPLIVIGHEIFQLTSVSFKQSEVSVTRDHFTVININTVLHIIYNINSYAVETDGQGGHDPSQFMASI